MDRQIFLAYDGSINADWVTRYALRFSSALPSRHLHVLHIEDGAFSGAYLDDKLATIVAAGKQLDVTVTVSRLGAGSGVFSALSEAIPAGPEQYCICGARATSRGKGFLAGTVSQRLLRAKRFNTLAIRVVNPGLLGCPENVMFPLAGHPRMFTAAMPFLQMIAPCARRLVVLRVMVVNPILFRYLPMTAARSKLRRGVDYLGKILDEIGSAANGRRLDLDERVVISDDWAKEILIQAGRFRTGLILLGASDRFLQSRFYYGNKIEQILRNTPSDVGIYRKI